MMRRVESPRSGVTRRGGRGQHHRDFAYCFHLFKNTFTPHKCERCTAAPRAFMEIKYWPLAIGGLRLQHMLKARTLRVHTPHRLLRTTRAHGIGRAGNHASGGPDVCFLVLK